MGYWAYLLLNIFSAIQGWHNLCIVFNIDIREKKGNSTHDCYHRKKFYQITWHSHNLGGNWQRHIARCVLLFVILTYDLILL